MPMVRNALGNVIVYQLDLMKMTESAKDLHV